MTTTREYLTTESNKYVKQIIEFGYSYVIEGANERLLGLLSQWRNPPGATFADNTPPPTGPITREHSLEIFDLNGDGDVSGADLGILLLTEFDPEHPASLDAPAVDRQYREIADVPVSPPPPTYPTTREYLTTKSSEYVKQIIELGYSYVIEGANERLLGLLSQWGDPAGTTFSDNSNPPVERNYDLESFDLNGDGDVSGSDLGILLITEFDPEFPVALDAPAVARTYQQVTGEENPSVPVIGSTGAASSEEEEEPIGVIEEQPINQNYIYPTYFRFTIAQLPKLEYFITKVTLPSFGYDSSLEQPNRFSIIRHPSNKVVFGPLEMDFLVDEDMSNWLEISNWIRKTSVVDDHLDIVKNTKDHYTQGTLLITNSAMNPNLEVTFYNMFPISITGFEFDSSVTELTPWTSTVTFAYDWYEVKKL